MSFVIETDSDGEIILPGRRIEASWSELLGPTTPEEDREFLEALAAIEAAEHAATIEAVGCVFTG